MATVKPPPAIRIRGTLTLPNATTPEGKTRYVYQRTSQNLANAATNAEPRLQRRVWINTPRPETPSQLQHKQRFADAYAAWQALNSEDRQPYIKIARQRKISPVNAWISIYSRAHPLPPAATINSAQQLTENGPTALSPQQYSPSLSPAPPTYTRLAKWRQT